MVKITDFVKIILKTFCVMTFLIVVISIISYRAALYGQTIKAQYTAKKVVKQGDRPYLFETTFPEVISGGT